jgi:hypothetical protein
MWDSRRLAWVELSNPLDTAFRNCVFASFKSVDSKAAGDDPAFFAI